MFTTVMQKKWLESVEERLLEVLKEKRAVFV